MSQEAASTAFSSHARRIDEAAREAITIGRRARGENIRGAIAILAQLAGVSADDIVERMIEIIGEDEPSVQSALDTVVAQSIKWA